MRLSILLLSLTSLSSLSACSTEFVYNSAQQAQLGECRKLSDLDERQRCIQRNSTSYDSYKKAQGEAATRQ